MSSFSVVALSVVLLLCQMQANGHFVMKEKGDDKFNHHVDIDGGSDSSLKPLDDSSFFLRFVPLLVEFSHPTLNASKIKKENNLPYRIRRNPQNATTIKTNRLIYMVHGNSVFSSTTPLSLLVNETSKMTEKNCTSEKDYNNIMSLATPSVIGKNVDNSTNLTTNFTNSSLSRMAIFNSSAEKVEERIKNFLLGLLGKLMSFFILAGAYYLKSTICGSQTRCAGYRVCPMIANNNFSEPVLCSMQQIYY